MINYDIKWPMQTVVLLHCRYYELMRGQPCCTALQCREALLHQPPSFNGSNLQWLWHNCLAMLTTDVGIMAHHNDKLNNICPLTRLISLSKCDIWLLSLSALPSCDVCLDCLSNIDWTLDTSFKLIAAGVTSFTVGHISNTLCLNPSVRQIFLCSLLTLSWPRLMELNSDWTHCSSAFCFMFFPYILFLVAREHPQLFSAC